MSNILQYYCIYLSTCNQAKKQIKIKILEVLRISDLIFDAFLLLLFLFIGTHLLWECKVKFLVRARPIVAIDRSIPKLFRYFINYKVVAFYEWVESFSLLLLLFIMGV